MLIWRRAYAIAPNPLAADDPRHPRFDARYAGLSAAELPATECLKDTVARVLPCWNDTIVPAIASGKRVLVVAHGNSIRALMKHLDQISDTDIVGLDIPNGVPVVYELDAAFRPISRRFLEAAEHAR